MNEWMNVLAVVNKNVIIAVVVTVVALVAVLDIVSCKSEYKEMSDFSCFHLDSIFFFISKLDIFSKNLCSKMSTYFSWITSTQWHFLFLWPILNNKTFNKIMHNKEFFFPIPNTVRVSLFSPMCRLTLEPALSIPNRQRGLFLQHKTVGGGKSMLTDLHALPKLLECMQLLSLHATSWHSV